jgi:hypothetical protein
MEAVKWEDIDREDAPERIESNQSKASLGSFWWAVSGLATICILLCLAWSSISSIVWEFATGFVFSQSFSNLQKYSQKFFAARYTFEWMAFGVVMPSATMMAVVPILFWRGGLLLRFGLTLAIAICVMNLANAGFYYSARFSWIRWGRSLQVSACWFAIPMLLLFSPMRTRLLRLTVSSLLVLMALCISILALIQAPRRDLFLWQFAYVGGFGWALLRRNWGNLALVERDSNQESISRTSSLTLLELMAISAVIVGGTTYHLRGIPQLYELQNAFVSLAMGGFTAALSSRHLVKSLSGERKEAKSLILLWGLLVTMLTTTTIAGSHYTIGYASALNSTEYVLFSTLASMMGGTFLLLQIWIVGRWLRWCGWRYLEISNAELQSL